MEVAVSGQRCASTVWQDFAACRDMGTRLFFPQDDECSSLARAICRRCPVRQACLAEALAEPALVGVWGGTTDMERNRLREHHTPGRLRLPTA
jgi:WhiB family redox-sensing transcriptional regulator